MAENSAEINSVIKKLAGPLRKALVAALAKVNIQELPAELPCMDEIKAATEAFTKAEAMAKTKLKLAKKFLDSMMASSSSAA